MKDNFILEKIEAGIKEGNALIARDIAENVEKFGISPVISIDGKLKNLRAKMIDCEEVKNLPKLVKKHGYSLEDFYIFESKTTKYGKDKTVLTSGFIIAISKKSGKIKEYKANHESLWINDFAADLKEKTFE
jgi:hypothetical protein